MGKLGKNLWQRLNSSESDRRMMLDSSIKIRSSLITRIMNLEYKLGINNSLHELHKYEEQLLSEKASLKGDLVLWLTVSPKVGIEFPLFRTKVKKFAERKMFTKYFYVFEQRGKTIEEIGKGFHCHLLLWRNLSYPPSQIIKNSKNTFKNITLVNNFEIFNYHFLAPHMVQDKKNYITLEKFSVDKKAKQSFDSLWRTQNDIESYYSNNEDEDKGEPPQRGGFDDSSSVSHDDVT